MVEAELMETIQIKQYKRSPRKQKQRRLCFNVETEARRKTRAMVLRKGDEKAH